MNYLFYIETIGNFATSILSTLVFMANLDKLYEKIVFINGTSTDTALFSILLFTFIHHLKSLIYIVKPYHNRFGGKDLSVLNTPFAFTISCLLIYGLANYFILNIIL